MIKVTGICTYKEDWDEIGRYYELGQFAVDHKGNAIHMLSGSGYKYRRFHDLQTDLLNVLKANDMYVEMRKDFDVVLPNIYFIRNGLYDITRDYYKKEV